LLPLKKACQLQITANLPTYKSSKHVFKLTVHAQNKSKRKEQQTFDIINKVMLVVQNDLTNFFFNGKDGII
jgi:hypothetical protein